MDTRLQAHYQNRIYYFNVVEHKPNEIAICMYNTNYIFIPIGERWDNHRTNKMNMVDGLIAAVLVAIGIV